MNLHDGNTGRAIREERNHKINANTSYRIKWRKARCHKYPRLKGAPNIMAHRNAMWKVRHGVN